MLYEEEDIPNSINNFPKRRVTINRPVFSEKDFESLCKDQDDLKEPLLRRTVNKFKNKVTDCSCSNIAKRFISFFPFLLWIRNYKKGYISKDISAGLTLGIFQIPQGKFPNSFLCLYDEFTLAVVESFVIKF